MSLSMRWFLRRVPNSGRLRSRLACRLELQTLEERTSPTDVFRSIDGSGNNLSHLAWGSAGSDLLRLAPAAYANGISTPAGTNRPSARVISNTVADQSGQDIISDRSLSAMIYAWGQFLDHDLDLTPSASPAEPFNVAVPSGDPSFDPGNAGTQ